MASYLKYYDLGILTLIFEQLKVDRVLLIVFAVVGMLPPAIMHLIAWNSGNQLNGWIFLRDIVTSVITTVTISYAVVSILRYLHRNYPWNKGVMKRLLLEIISTTTTAIVLIVLLTFLFYPIIPHDDLRETLFSYVVIAFLMNLILVTITEGVFFFKEWNRSRLDAEMYKREHLKAQLESLRAQVNPHFLFNSLNTLSSMIDYDKELSKKFLDDLAFVYRYVLKNQGEELVTLKTELEFLNAFIGLLAKRFGTRAKFEVDVSPALYQEWLPPMTLQLLVENAVKHNVASRKKPLLVQIFDEDEKLVIQNNLQLKSNVESNGLGLNNVDKRFKYLMNQGIVVSKTAEFFRVELPLIGNYDKISNL